MKCIYVMKKAWIICLLMGMTACSSDNVVVGNVKVSEVKTSECKTSVSKDDTRPEFYDDVFNQKATLTMQMGTGNTVDARFLDVRDNCIIGQFHVDASCNDHQLVLVLYPEKDALTDCVCRYDVDFKIQDLLPGDYQLAVYHTTSTKEVNASNRIFQGTVTLNAHQAITLTMDR